MGGGGEIRTKVRGELPTAGVASKNCANSPKCPNGLGNVIIILKQSHGNLGIVPKTRQSLVTRRSVAFFSDGCVCIFVKYLQDGFTKIQTHAMNYATMRCFFFRMDAFVSER